MLIDATHEEETRVAICDGTKLTEYDYESRSRKPLKGSIFLAKVTRVEPSLQAAFVNFGGNRHGFLPFSEIHPDYFRIPIADREALMAEQEALLREHDEEDQDDEGSDSADSLSGNSLTSEEGDLESSDGVSDPEDIIEEVGGAVPSFEDDLDSDEIERRPSVEDSNVFIPETRDLQDDTNPVFIGEDSHAADFQSDTSLENSFTDGQEFNSNRNQEDSSRSEGHHGDGRRGGGRSRRFRGGRGRRHSAYRNPNVEVVGGEDADDRGFRFNLRRKYKIQEVIKRGQIMLVQVSKEERGNKGAAVGSYLSLPGRYCVLMPNSPRAGGVSRKIANSKDRSRMREIMKELEVPKGMSVIVRTAGVTRTKAEIKRDLDYLMRLWDNIRELTLQSTAPALVYEEADLIKRCVRDLYGRDVEEILVAGEAGYKNARDFMKMMIPSHIKKVVHYEDDQIPLFTRFQVETQIQEIGQPVVRLKSGGYIVINPTEALVSIDVNSGKATKERHIEETALKTNLEAADEIARQLRLRDLGGLVVIDFIDMEDRRNNAKVERRMREALSIDRARSQVGRISSFGLMELSRQRLNPSLTESQYETCTSCKGLGLVRTRDAMSILVLRAIEDEGLRRRAAQIVVHVSTEIALYILNNKRKALTSIESRYDLEVLLRVDDQISVSDYRIEVSKPSEALAVKVDPEKLEDRSTSIKVSSDQYDEDEEEENSEQQPITSDSIQEDNRLGRRRGRRGGRNRKGRGGDRKDFQNKPDDLSSGPEIIDSDSQYNVRQPREPEGNEEDFNDDSLPNGNVIEDRPPSDRGRNKRRRRGRRGPFGERQVSEISNNFGSDTVSSENQNQTYNVPPDEGVSVQKSLESKPNDRDIKRMPRDEAVSVETRSVPLPKREVEPRPPSEHEVVNQEPKEKKRGWWNRFVE